ncbi:DNA damage-inducible protein DinB [Croceivirga lutea]|uniref:DinB family protein n=1 Tax=Croceivirga lutea TaxID=1775167 RepID=UPI00163A9C61|nr:DinB family protein [Croceivirga lutea]GGG44456.1 DNA damage-inducible protein DinB [Croceivirga lutea]
MSYNTLTIADITDSEFNSFYQVYINKCKGKTLSESFQHSLNQWITIGEKISSSKLNYAYAVNKWTLAEVLLHLNDAERIFQYRALRFARNDNTSLPGFDENNYVVASNANLRTKISLIEEGRLLRQSTLSLFQHFSTSDLARIGTASNSQMSVRAIGFVICGHQLHHIDIIKERYLNLI